MAHQFTDYLNSIGTQLHIATGTHKSALAEDYGKIVKTRLTRYLDMKNTHTWAPKPLEMITKALNARYLASIGTSPDKVTVYDNHRLFLKRYGDLLHAMQQNPKLKLGDVVRLRLQKTGAFVKGYTANFSDELYVISNVIRAPPTFRYHLADQRGNEIDGSFYAFELLHVFEHV